jgi:N-methylhydantoinase B
MQTDTLIPAGETVSPIALQVWRSNLEAIGNEGLYGIERTAISPVVVEALDCATAILDHEGRLIALGGMSGNPGYTAIAHIRSVIRHHGDTIAEGDVFLGNDPFADASMHPNDVFVSEPVYVDGELVGWIASTAHLMDVGGMVFGSFAPHATECYQEAVRVPPVRLFRGGAEQTDVWTIFLNNVRISDLVEMDLRALVAGCHVSKEKLADLARSLGKGGKQFRAMSDAFYRQTKQEIERRISALQDGVYCKTSYADWNNEFFKLPCRLTIQGKRMVFDFTGASPQCDHFINSRPYLIQGAIANPLGNYVFGDLPICQAIAEAVEVICPEGTIVNASAPAPCGASHYDVPGTAASAATVCLVQAMAASSENIEGNQFITAQQGNYASDAFSIWSYVGDGFAVMDGTTTGGSPAAKDRDGNDLLDHNVAQHGSVELIDVEVFEDWYPVLISGKWPGGGPGSEGKFRGGAGMHMIFQPHLIDRIYGVTMAKKEHLPNSGLAGGRPGGGSELWIIRADGSRETVDNHTMGVELREGEFFEFKASSGGGYGDPLERDPLAVQNDLALGRTTAQTALDTYGVVVGNDGVDWEATELRRRSNRDERLARAEPARQPLSTADVKNMQEGAVDAVIYPGIVRSGSVAYSLASGAPLAVAPNHWTDGCPVLRERHANRSGIDVIYDTYLDPLTGAALEVDARLDGDDRSFTSLPRSWTG